MEAEFFAVDGPLLGERFPLGGGDVHIGSAPSAHIRLAEADAAREHCTVRFADGRFEVVDHRSGAGTYVNGMRIARHCLEPGDQVSICDTVLLYREDTASPQPESQQHTLLRACSLLFLFRALGMSTGGHRSVFADQIVRLIADIAPCREGVVLLGRDADELCAAAGEPAAAAPLHELIGRVCREGSVVEPAARVVALALYVGGEIAGLLAAWFPAEEIVNLSDHRDTLSAIGTVAAAALENVRSVERLQAENASLLSRLGAGEAGMVGESPGVRKLLGICLLYTSIPIPPGRLRRRHADRRRLGAKVRGLHSKSRLQHRARSRDESRGCHFSLRLDPARCTRQCYRSPARSDDRDLSLIHI